MDYDYYTFRSVTRGQLALRYLQAADIPAMLQRTPKKLATEGCGYVIRVRSTEANRAERLFAENQIGWQRRFSERNGRFLEVRYDLP